jgi:adhesin transport system outer membrane protein
MQNKRWWLFGLLIAPFCALAQVQTLKESAQQVVLTNPEVLARWHAFEAANGERDVAFGAFLPRFDVTAGAGRDKYDDPSVLSNLNRRSTTLTLTQLLYDGFATSNDVKRLDFARRVRLFELYDAIETAVLETTRAYFDVLRYRLLVSLAEENYVRHRSVFDQIQRKTMAGVGRRVDLEQAAGRLALAESNLLTETANLHDVSARFQRLVGAPPRKDMEESSKLDKGLPTDMTLALKAATSHHPALQAAIENVRSAERSAKVRNAAFQPRFDVRVRSEKGSNLGGISGSTRNNIAEVVMTWNLFNGFSDISRVRQYAEQLNVARDQRDKTCRDLRQTLAIAYNDIRKLKEQLTYLDQHQLSIEKARDAYRKQFDIGQRSLLDVLDTENELFQAKRAYTNAEYDLRIAYARTHAGTGTLFMVLGLTRQNIDPLPVIAQNDSDAPVACPPEAPEIYTVDKAALNLRAQELVRESVQSAADAAAALAVPGSPPAAVTPPGPVAPMPPTLPSPEPSVAEPPPLAAAEEAAVSSKKAVINALKAWTAAWAGRNIQAYLDSYAPTFKPAGGISRDAWVAQRKAVLTAARQIDLTVSKVRVEMKEPKRAVITFLQRYRSASYRDVVQKTLEWENVDGRWLIVKEIAEPPAKR